MQRTLPPLLGREEKSLALRVTGKVARFLRPVKGATTLACAWLALAAVAAEDITVEAIVCCFLDALHLVGSLHNQSSLDSNHVPLFIQLVSIHPLSSNDGSI